MIVDGQIHGGLTMGLAPALYEEITYDENGNNLAGTFMDYLLPTAVETPAWEVAKTVTPSPHHPIGAKGVGESATVGAPPAIANAVVDALWHLGVRNIDIPITPPKVWAILHEKGVDRLTGDRRDDRTSFARAAELDGGRPAVRARHRRRGRTGRPRPGPARTASSIRTARSRAGSAAPAPSRSSSARRSARWPTASRGCSGSRRTRRPRAAAATASSSS